MSEIPGVLLKDVWNTMTASQHITCIRSIAFLVKELCAIDIPHYGSLYSLTDGQGDLLAFDTRYGVGPFCKAHHHTNKLAQIEDPKTLDKSLGPCAFPLPSTSTQC
jgi:hypothetical protein